jgi:hypothetical protein
LLIVIDMTSSALTTGIFPIVLPASDATGVGSQQWLLALAHRIADSGIQAVEADVAVAARHLRRTGQCPLLLDVLVDTTQPAVARERAYGQLLVEAAAPTTLSTVAA